MTVGLSEERVMFARLSTLDNDTSRQRFLKRHRRLVRRETVERLIQSVQSSLRVDTPQALRLAESAVAISQCLGQTGTLARSLRAKANALYFSGQNQQAVDCHTQAIALFRELGEASELARSLSASIQPLALLGQYESAFAVADEARKIFESCQDPLRLARLSNNVGNILHRQDRFDEALACYERAYQQLPGHQHAESLAVTLHNTAVCLISLNEFERALDTYHRSRTLTEQHNLPLLTVQADYNVAYLYYLRGQYGRAIGMLRATRNTCAEKGDRYHLALCNLDQSEMYLELNLIAEAAEMAREAVLQFQQLGMNYEAAKSLTNLAVAVSRQRSALPALEMFREARDLFVREGNHVWPSLLDLYQALVLYHEGRLFEARRLVDSALQFFGESVLRSKAVSCRLLLARLSFRAGDLKSAVRHCTDALGQLALVESPSLDYQTHLLLGQIHEAQDDSAGAYQAYQSARRTLETLRSSLCGDELKIAFMKNKVEVYEGLVRLCLARATTPRSMEEAFDYMEQSKSRSLRDLVFGRTYSFGGRETGQSELVRRIRDLREKLNWYYHRIELEQLSREKLSPERIQQLQAQARAREDELQHALRELPTSDSEYAAFYAAAPLPLDEIRATLPDDTTLVEYFRIGERLVAAVLERDRLEIYPVTVVTRVTHLLSLLHFQLSKFRLGPEYVATFPEAMLNAARRHLHALYDEVLAPVRDQLQGRHVVFVPHDVLHYLPFHALFDGRQYVIDAFTTSYAPSATMYALCQRLAANTQRRSLVLGISDTETPCITQEVQSIARILPEAELFIGPDATRKVLEERGPHSMFLHIATHGYFRRDNPMFSSVRLGDSYLSLYDLYRLKLPAELVTLSGCATGLNVVAAGDELLGLVRGFLHAGARSLLLSLWDVHDQSTADLMQCFYRDLQLHGDKAAALRSAMLQVRERYPHPYYWAPFMLVGKAFGA